MDRKKDVRREIEAIVSDVKAARTVAECLAGDADPAVGHLGSAQKVQLDRAEHRLEYLLDEIDEFADEPTSPSIRSQPTGFVG